MKKALFVALATLLSYAASAQYDPYFRFGLKGGGNLSNIRGNDLSLNAGGSAFNFKDNENRSWGFAGGIFMRFGRTFYVQPELLLSQKGGEFNVYRDGLTPDGKFDVRFTNLDVPILLGGRFARFFRINAGPMVTFRMAENGKLGQSFEDYTGTQTEEVFNNRTAFGYQAGVGLDLGRLSLDVRYEGNFNDVVNLRFNDLNTEAKFGRKSNLWQATLGIALF